MTLDRELLTNAMHEIRDLRRRNEILSAKVEMIDLFACVLHTSPASRSQGMAPDVAWALERKIEELKNEEANNAHQGQTSSGIDEGQPARNGS